MSTPADLSIRQMKPAVIQLIRTSCLSGVMNTIHNYPPLKVTNVLLSLLYHPDETVYWPCVSLIGEVVSRLAGVQTESARTVMRRLMWNLNDESGGIGWGSPQAMGEIMARSRRMSDEYGHILVSYIRPDGNFIEHPGLQAGVLWGLGRLLHAYPQHGIDIERDLIPFFESADTRIRGMAAWIAAAVSDLRITPLLAQLKEDDASVRIWMNGLMIKTTVRQLLAGNPV